MKLNELLRALHEPDNHLINIERLSEEELRELHARYEKLQTPEPAALEVQFRVPEPPAVTDGLNQRHRPNPRRL
jgi:hypothetical protein